MRKLSSKELTRRSRKSKAKGYDFEVEVVQALADAGIEACRIWGSDGRAQGYPADVDVVTRDEFYIQAKRRRSLPDWLDMGSVHAVVIREDHGDRFALIRFDSLIRLMKTIARLKTEASQSVTT